MIWIISVLWWWEQLTKITKLWDLLANIRSTATTEKTEIHCTFKSLLSSGNYLLHVHVCNILIKQLIGSLNNSRRKHTNTQTHTLTQSLTHTHSQTLTHTHGCKHATAFQPKLKFSYLLQLIMTSSGITRRFSMPCFGWSPRPRNNPGGSILKLPIFSLCPSIMQKPYSAVISSFFLFSSCEVKVWFQRINTGVVFKTELKKK